MPDTSGPTSATPLAYYDPESSCWKTSQATFLSEAQPSLAALPPSGMTRAGWLYELPTWVPATDGPAGSALLATPIVPNGGRTLSAEDVAAKGATAKGKRQVDLNNQVRHLLPTPNANESDPTEEFLDEIGSRPSLLHLEDAIALLPTPKATNNENRQTEWANGPNLGEALRALPTPTARLGEPRGAQAKRYENPDRPNDLDDAVAWLTSDPSPPPSSDTPTLWDDQPHHQS